MPRPHKLILAKEKEHKLNNKTRRNLCLFLDRARLTVPPDSALYAKLRKAG